MTEAVSVVDVVSESLYQAMFAVRNFFKTEPLANLEDFVPVILAMQALPQSLMEEVGIAIMADFFESEALDPSKPFDRRCAAPFAKLIAQNISIAGQALIRQMQQDHAAQEKAARELRTGTFGLVRHG